MAKLPEPAAAGDDDIPDFLRGVIDADATAKQAATQATKSAPAKLPEPAAEEDDDIPDFLKGALGSGAGTQPVEYNQYDYNQYGGYDNQDYNEY
jgi:hypothetical protein